MYDTLCLSCTLPFDSASDNYYLKTRGGFLRWQRDQQITTTRWKTDIICLGKGVHSLMMPSVPSVTPWTTKVLPIPFHKAFGPCTERERERGELRRCQASRFRSPVLSIKFRFQRLLLKIKVRNRTIIRCIVDILKAIMKPSLPEFWRHCTSH